MSDGAGAVWPRLYGIVDAEMTRARGLTVVGFAEELRAAGVMLVQYRDKVGSAREVLEGASALRAAFAESGCRLVMNDRADLAVLAGFDGVHVGQGDLSVAEVKAVAPGRDTPPYRDRAAKGWGTRSSFFVGISTHTEEQVRAADWSEAAYVAIGPVFATSTKRDAEAAVGLDGVRRARGLTTKPLVAIGGITRANARSVVEAGADSVAVIGGLLVKGETVEKVARDFLDLFR